MMKIWNGNRILILAVATILGFILCLASSVLINSANVKIVRLLWPPTPNLLEEEFEPQILRTMVQEDSTLEQLWNHSNVHIVKSTGPFVTAAADGILFYLTGETNVSQGIMALDAKDGETALWSSTAGYPAAIYATPNALFLGGLGKVSAHNLRTDEELWSARWWYEGIVTHLQIEGGLVYVKTGRSGSYLLRADTGQSIKKRDWASIPEFNDKYFLNRILTEDIEFRIGPGEISATDRQTGHVLWHEKADSNAVITEAAVYIISREDEELKLLGLDPRSGKTLVSVTFEPFDAPDYRDVYDYHHRLALDKELGILYVFFRDSEQVFAFKITDYLD